MLLAVFFVGSGLLTYQVYYWVSKTGTDEYELALQLLTGLPFALACTLRFVRPRRWTVLAVFLDCVTWVVAFRLGLALLKVNPYFGMALAGAVGALGVMASTGLGCRVLWSRRTLAIAALVGAIAGAPFGLILNRSQQENLILAISFPLWQVAVGMWIWMSSELEN
jgi:hypothetical protein